jgi:hypothetical protein
MEQNTHEPVFPNIGEHISQSWKLANETLGMVWGLIARFIILPTVLALVIRFGVGLLGGLIGYTSPALVVVISIISFLIVIALSLYQGYQGTKFSLALSHSKLFNYHHEAAVTARSAASAIKVSVWYGLALSILTALFIYAGFVLFIIPGIMIALALNFVMRVYALENETVLGAIARSRAITYGYKWSLFGRSLLFGVIMAVLFGIVAALGILLSPWLFILMIPLVVFAPGFAFAYQGIMFKKLVTRTSAHRYYTKPQLVGLSILSVVVVVAFVFAYSASISARKAAMEQAMMMQNSAQQMQDPELIGQQAQELLNSIETAQSEQLVTPIAQ